MPSESCPASKAVARTLAHAGWLALALCLPVLSGCLPVVQGGYPAPQGPSEPPPPPPAPPGPPPWVQERPVRREARLRFSPASLDFGAVEVGSSAALDVRVRNDGDDEARIAGAEVDGEGFRVVDSSCDRRVLRPGESCTVQVRFDPRFDGRLSGALSLTGPDVGRRPDVPLVGEGMQGRGPSLTVSPPRLDFDRAGTREVEVRNEGRRDVRVREVAMEGRGFLVATDGCSGRSLPPRAACSLSVRFSPEGPGERAGTLGILVGDREGTRLLVPLTGEEERRGAPNARAEPVGLDFGRVPEGQARTADVAIRNEGRADLRVQDLRIDGRGFEFVSDGCSRVVVEPGRSCRATVRFSPQGPGPQAGSVTAVTNDPRQGRLTVALNGEGERRGRPEARVEPARLDFGRLDEGQARTLDVAVRNEGRADLRVDEARIEGQGFTLVRDACSGQVVAPGRSCVASVRFSAEGAGPRSGSLGLRTDDPGQRRLEVPLTGESVARGRPEARVNPERLEFARVPVGEARVLEAEIRNDGRAELRVEEVTVDGRGFAASSDACSGRSLPPGRSCRVAVRYAPPGEGQHSGAVAVASNDPDRPRLTVALRGEGTGRIAPDLKVSSPRLDFGPVPVGQKRALELEVRNEGRAELSVREASVEGRWFREARDGCSRQALAPGRSCAVSIAFAPEAAGSSTGSLRLVSNDPDNPRLQVPVEGQGVEAPGPRPCRAVTLGRLREDGLVVDVDLGKGECAAYTVSVEPGVLFVRTPEGFRFEGEGFKAEGVGPRRFSDRFPTAKVQRLKLSRPSDVTFTLTRGDGGSGKAPLALEWSAKEGEERRGRD